MLTMNNNFNLLKTLSNIFLIHIKLYVLNKIKMSSYKENIINVDFAGQFSNSVVL
jgi:hypothetical protein